MGGNVRESNISITTGHTRTYLYVLELLLVKKEPAKVVKRGIIR